MYKINIEKFVLIFVVILYCNGSLPKDTTLLTVNKKNSLSDFKPNNLVNFNGIQVSQRIVKDLKKLLDSAKKDGLTLKVVSGYRSFERQTNLYNSYIKKEMLKNPKLTKVQAEEIVNSYSAKPGHSEHQLGTTVDILSSENNYQFDLKGDLKYAKWLEENSLKFNFKISYPKNHPEYTYEPWHLRWYPKAK